MVIAHFTENGAVVVAQRFKTPFAELDLLFKKGHKYYLVEVKKVDSSFDREWVSKKQRERLRNAHLYLLARYPNLKSLLAVVSQQGKITYVEDFL
jgi:Holliday junction resolvase-like predicted endonuclease